MMGNRNTSRAMAVLVQGTSSYIAYVPVPGTGQGKLAPVHNVKDAAEALVRMSEHGEMVAVVIVDGKALGAEASNQAVEQLVAKLGDVPLLVWVAQDRKAALFAERGGLALRRPRSDRERQKQIAKVIAAALEGGSDAVREALADDLVG